MPDLRERFDLADGLETPDLWESAVARARDLPPERGMGRTAPDLGRRVAAGAVALVVFLLAAAFAWRAFSDRGDSGVASSHNYAMVPSGGTYRPSNVSVEFPAEAEPGQPDPVAAVSFDSEWSTERYPGEAACTVRLFDSNGQVVASEQSGFAHLDPSEHVTLTVPVADGTPVASDVDCGPGMIFTGSSYIFDDVHIVGEQVIANVTWSAGTPVGTAACAARVVTPDGTVSVHT
jgi:hypothetical protein